MSEQTKAAIAKITTLPIIEAKKIGSKTNYTVSYGFATEEDAVGFSDAIHDISREVRKEKRESKS